MSRNGWESLKRAGFSTDRPPGPYVARRHEMTLLRRNRECGRSKRIAEAHTRLRRPLLSGSRVIFLAKIKLCWIGTQLPVGGNPAVAGAQREETATPSYPSRRISLHGCTGLPGAHSNSSSAVLPGERLLAKGDALETGCFRQLARWVMSNETW